MDFIDGRSQPPPDPRGEADLASTTEFKAFLAGEPIPTGRPPAHPTAPARTAGWPASGPCSRAAPAAEHPSGVLGRDLLAPDLAADHPEPPVPVVRGGSRGRWRRCAATPAGWASPRERPGVPGQPDRPGEQGARRTPAGRTPAPAREHGRSDLAAGPGSSSIRPAARRRPAPPRPAPRAWPGARPTARPTTRTGRSSRAARRRGCWSRAATASASGRPAPAPPAPGS